VSDKTFEDRIFDAVVEQFLRPLTVQYPQPDGSVTSYNTPSPFVQAVASLYEAKRDEIMKHVDINLDLRKLADTIATKVAEQLTREFSQKDRYWDYDYKRRREDIDKRVHEKLAEMIAKRTLEQMDSERSTSSPPSTHTSESSPEPTSRAENDQ
jgi:hypothetical protein